MRISRRIVVPLLLAMPGSVFNSVAARFIRGKSFFVRACLVFCLLFFPVGAVQAYPVNAFNAKALLNVADVVCYGTVVSVKDRPVEPDTNFSPSLESAGGVATVRVITGLLQT